MKKFLIFVIAWGCISMLVSSAIAQEKTGNQQEKIKTGWTFGLLPAIAFDSDLGFKYGGLVNFYNFGDGHTYPDYLQSIYLEISRTTKGSGVNQLFFDSEHLFPDKKIRLTADLSFLTEQALDFYGFNGAETVFNPDFTDESSDLYISRLFYRHERKLTRFYADFQGYIIPDKLRWLAGVYFLNFKLAPVNIDKLNEGKKPEDTLPHVDGLYDKYVDWGLIPAQEADGGHNQFVKFGLVWDTRDIEANPGKGLWTECLFMSAPSFLGNKENAFTKLIFIHRQYFTLWPGRLTFVYRLAYQGTLAGKAPFYFQPYLISSYSPSVITEGLGGAKSLRGILRNRVVGDDIFYSNFEFRFKFIKTVVAGQNLYFAVNPFVDAGRVVGRIETDLSGVPSNVRDDFFSSQEEKMHYTAGCGLHIALNENFVLAINYGRALDRNDGKSGLYIGTNWLF